MKKRATSVLIETEGCKWKNSYAVGLEKLSWR